MTKWEAETCRVPWTFFLPYRPNGCADSMATPSMRAYPLPPRRFGGHGALSRENRKRRGKTVQALAGCSSFRAAVSAVIQFSLRKKEKSFSGTIKVPSLHEEAKRTHYAPGRCSSLKCSYLKCSALICVHYTPVQALCKLDVLSGHGKRERKLAYLFDCA